MVNCCVDDGQEKSSSEDAPGNNPQYTTVYVGNLAPEVYYYYNYYLFFHLMNLSVFFFRVLLKFK